MSKKLLLLSIKKDIQNLINEKFYEILMHIIAIQTEILSCHEITGIVVDDALPVVDETLPVVEDTPAEVVETAPDAVVDAIPGEVVEPSSGRASVVEEAG